MGEVKKMKKIKKSKRAKKYIVGPILLCTRKEKRTNCSGASDVRKYAD